MKAVFLFAAMGLFSGAAHANWTYCSSADSLYFNYRHLVNIVGDGHSYTKLELSGKAVIDINGSLPNQPQIDSASVTWMSVASVVKVNSSLDSPWGQVYYLRDVRVNSKENGGLLYEGKVYCVYEGSLINN